MTDEKEPITELKRMTDDELREFIDGFVSGNIITDAQVDKDLIPSVFMPLKFGAASILAPIIEDIGCIYEHMSAPKSPMGINGYPIFFSFQVMHKADWKIVLNTYQKEKVRRDTLPIIREDE